MSIDTNNRIIKAVSQFYGIDPTLLDPEIITMMGVWHGSGDASTVQPDGYVYQPGYTHFIWGVGAFVQPGGTVSDYARLQFNIFPGLANNKPLFTVPLNMAAFFSTTGAANCVNLLPGFKILPDKSQLNTQLTPNPADPTWLGTAVSVGVVVYGVRLQNKA